ncbi:hypothetical protein [Microbacterium oxydans]|uniref:hypothetical protein n=1 Tax=Microbacterium oxydans TaxID=82380 RepID=UPI0012E0370B|nr:hypothetical protein [Microbacterium oxydans]
MNIDARQTYVAWALSSLVFSESAGNEWHASPVAETTPGRVSPDDHRNVARNTLTQNRAQPMSALSESPLPIYDKRVEDQGQRQTRLRRSFKSPGADGRRVDEQRDDALAAKTSHIRCRIVHGRLGIDVLHILTGRVMSVGALRSTSMEIPHDVIHWRLPPRAELSDVDQRELVRLVLLVHEDLHRPLSVTDPTVIHPLSVSARGFIHRAAGAQQTVP